MSGPVVTSDGMLVDFFDVKACIDAWDHRHLNDEVDVIPTAELLATEMRRRLLALLVDRHALAAAASATTESADHHPGDVGVLLRLWETPAGYAQVGWLTADPAAPAQRVELPE